MAYPKRGTMARGSVAGRLRELSRRTSGPRVRGERTLYLPTVASYIFAAMMLCWGVGTLVFLPQRGRPLTTPDAFLLLLPLAGLLFAYRLAVARIWLDETGIHCWRGFRTRTVSWTELDEIEKRYVGKGQTNYWLHRDGRRYMRLNDSQFFAEALMDDIRRHKRVYVRDTTPTGIWYR